MAKLTFLLIALIASDSFAVTRTVYFSGTGRNTSTSGFSAAQTSRCVIIIQNQSSNSQTIQTTSSLAVSATSATGSLAGGGTRADATTTSAWSGSATNFTFTANTALAAGATLGPYTFNFPSFPAKTTLSGAYAQKVTCNGKIVVDDTSAAAPGTITAVGHLDVFAESATMRTVGSTSTASFGGYPIFNQVPIIINRGKPF